MILVVTFDQDIDKISRLRPILKNLVISNCGKKLILQSMNNFENNDLQEGFRFSDDLR